MLLLFRCCGYVPLEQRRLPEVYVFSEPRPREQQVEDGPLVLRPVRDAAVHRPLIIHQNVADGELRDPGLRFKESVSTYNAPIFRQIAQIFGNL